MLRHEDNEKLTRTGPGTPLGRLLRQYWQPAALVSEIDEQRPAKAVRLLGEDLVLFRTPDTGQWALVSRFCAHRGVDLAYGRLEDGGLRCLYHGWLYGPDGQCLEQPAEPPESRFHTKVRIAGYPCQERNGIIFAYLGKNNPPPLPAYDCFTAPAEYTFAFKGLWECNWLQGLEGGLDPSHVSFLHRFLKVDPREVYGQQFSEEVEGTSTKLSTLVADHFRPDIEVTEAPHGLRVFATRDLHPSATHVRVTNYTFPNAFTVPIGNTKIFTQWHVPVDDENHYWYMIYYDLAEPVDQDTLLRQRLQGVTLPDYRSVRNRDNHWGYDPAEQRELTYTGMGLDINVHDQFAVESMGRVADRTAERLGTSDRAVIAARRLLLRAADAGRAGLPARPVTEDAAASLTGPAAADGVCPADRWREHWKTLYSERIKHSPWAAQAALSVRNDDV